MNTLITSPALVLPRMVTYKRTKKIKSYNTHIVSTKRTLAGGVAQLIQAYHQYGVCSCPALSTTKRCTRLAAASDQVYQLLADGWWFRVL